MMMEIKYTYPDGSTKVIDYCPGSIQSTNSCDGCSSLHENNNEDEILTIAKYDYYYYKLKHIEITAQLENLLRGVRPRSVDTFKIIENACDEFNSNITQCCNGHIELYNRIKNGNMTEMEIVTQSRDHYKNACEKMEHCYKIVVEAIENDQQCEENTKCDHIQTPGEHDK